jgi:hypothetical protein
MTTWKDLIQWTVTTAAVVTVLLSFGSCVAREAEASRERDIVKMRESRRCEIATP